MKILIKTLTLRNFKGIKNFTANFTDITDIFGENASGKTTLFDAFLWLLFGKDSSDRKDFNIKPLDSKNNAVSRLEYEVSGLILVDSKEVSLKRTYREKWVKKRGESTEEFSGHETDFFYNDVPHSQAEFKAKIDSILKEEIFKLITSSVYYNSLKWQDRRNILMEMAGDVTDSDVLAAVKNGKDFSNLMFVLNSGKSLVEYRREITAKKKIIRDNLALIPARIDEVKRNKPEPVDKDVIESKITDLNNQVAAIDNAIANKNDAYQKEFQQIQEKQTQINTHKSRQQAIIFELKTQAQNATGDISQKRNEFTNRIRTIELDIQSKNSLLTNTETRKIGLDSQLAQLRTQWSAINQEELKFDDHEFNCPTCKRAFDESDIEARKETLQQNFIDDKNRKLANNRSEGQRVAAEVKNCEETITTVKAEIETLTAELNSHNEQLSIFNYQQTTDAPSVDELLAGNDEYVSLGSKIAALEQQVQNRPVIDITELKDQKAVLYAQLDTLKGELNNQVLIDQMDSRVKELEAEEKKLSQEITDLELTEFLINDFDKTKMNIIESRINGKFKYVSFKMFNRQINGGEEPCCETLINGVPYSDANNAARINAGIDIINALCEHYQVWAPIFIDNRESVTELLDSKSQIVNLVVVKGARLSVNKVEYAKEAVAA